MAAQTEAKGRVGGTRALQVQGALRARVLIIGDTVGHWRVVYLQPSLNDQKSNLLLSRARLTTDAAQIEISQYQRAPLYTILKSNKATVTAPAPLSTVRKLP